MFHVVTITAEISQNVITTAGVIVNLSMADGIPEEAEKEVFEIKEESIYSFFFLQLQSIYF